MELQEKDGRPELCWFGGERAAGECPYKLGEREPYVVRAYGLALQAVSELPESDPIDSKRRKMVSRVSGEAFKFVCWFYKISKVAERERLREWAVIVADAINRTGGVLAGGTVKKGRHLVRGADGNLRRVDDEG